MGISLTKEQFYERFRKHQGLFALALEEDARKIFPLSFKVPQNEAEIHINMTKPIGELIAKEIARIIDLVYEEALD
jgi:hypothetical protein